MTTNIRQLVRLSPAQILAGGGQEDIDYMLDRPPFTRYLLERDGICGRKLLGLHISGCIFSV